MDEGTVSLQGDMPRYLMNGVYFHDLIRDFPITNPIEYTYQYFARYPALSLGHHPLLLGIAEVPFYAVFGISVFSGRLTIVCFMLLAGIAWFSLIRSIYDEDIAFFSSLLFVTTPFIVSFSRVVMSEIPALSLIIVAMYFFYQYCKCEKNKYLYAFAAALLFSILARQQAAIFMVPIFLCYFLITKCRPLLRKPRLSHPKEGIKRFITKKMILPGLIIALLLLPIIFVTLKYSQTNVRWIFRKSLSSRIELSNLLYHLKAIWKYHLTLPVLILSLVSIGVSVYRKDKRAIIFLLWIAGYYLLITYTGANNSPRYSIYWIPAFCILTATAVVFFHYRRWKILISTILIVIAGYQFVIAFHSEPTYAEGYEEAARYVVENRKGESVLFSSSADTGYFIFFARKHNPNKDLIVLRADKILVTSRISRIIEERIKNREEIYEILRDFGTCYVVIEDKEFKSPPLEWLREEVKSDRFILRKRIPIHSNSYKLQDVVLGIYEYKEYTPPKRGKKLQMNIPLIGDSISVEFDDLLHNKYTNRMK